MLHSIFLHNQSLDRSLSLSYTILLAHSSHYLILILNYITNQHTTHLILFLNQHIFLYLCYCCCLDISFNVRQYKFQAYILHPQYCNSLCAVCCELLFFKKKNPAVVGFISQIVVILSFLIFFWNMNRIANWFVLVPNEQKKIMKIKLNCQIVIYS